MIIWRWNDLTHGGRVKVYPRVLSEDWFFFFSVLWCLAAKAFRGGKNCNHLLSFSGKLHFTTLNYALDYTLHPKLSDCTLCTLNYYTYHILHPNVIVAVIFNKILLHVISTCFLLRWNKVKILKYPSSKSIKTKPKIFPISLFLALTMKVWMIVQ